MPRLFLSALLAAAAAAQVPPQAPPTPPAATLGLLDHLDWLDDGQDLYERDPRPLAVPGDRGALVDRACAQAREQQKLVLWYVPRVQERK
ncbi:MAG: hypothetical protein FJ265_19550, partial [Planctomycetes bacterium]|nr:hypothetical protein [Planctomycetota bacterium]